MRHCSLDLSVRTVKGRTLASRNSESQMEKSWLRKLLKNFDAFSSFLFSPNNYWVLTCSRYYLRHQGTLENNKKGSCVDTVVLPQCSVLRTDWQICIKHLAARAMVTAILTASATAAINSSDKKQDLARSRLSSPVARGKDGCRRACAPSPRSVSPFRFWSFTQWAGVLQPLGSRSLEGSVAVSG